MKFLRNVWYCAGFSDSIPEKGMHALRLLNEPVVFYRQKDGKVVALQDRCPHRFASLSQGKLIDDQVQCPYHGLRFDGSGQCRHNPHGDGTIPKAAQVRTYPVIERHGALWIWMGDAERADPALLPDFSPIDERPGWTRVQGYLHVRANYEIMTDNLLDLSHVQFLHPFLANNEPPPPDFKMVKGLEQDGNSVVAISELHSYPNTPLFKMLWEHGAPPQYINLRANMRWSPPSLLFLDTGATPVNGTRADGPSIPVVHLLTPETETTTHYFWAGNRDRFVGNPQVSEQVRHGIGTVFLKEDEPMVEACQHNMGTTDLMSLKPVMLATDGPPIRARRVLAGLIEAEANSANA